MGDARFERATFGSGEGGATQRSRGVEGALGTIWDQSELRERAARLLRAVADAHPIEVEEARGLARAVLAARVVESARAVLDAEPAFLLTRAVSLAALLLEARACLPAGHPAGRAAAMETRTPDRKERRR